jgi:hypothetical protein
MKSPRADRDESRMETVIQEFQTLIERSYSPVCFEVKPGDDPVGTDLIVTVAIDDPDEVVDVYAEKLLTLQVEAGLPLYIVPVRSVSEAQSG